MNQTFDTVVFTARLKSLESALGSTRKVIAERLDIRPQTLKSYIDGAALPNAKVLASIISEFSVNPYWLLFGSGEMFANETARAVSTEQDPVLRRLEGVETMLVRHGASPEEIRDALRMALRTLTAAGADDEVSEKPEAAVS